ncbi:hypothetical protein [Lentzea sp. NPDC051838]|uniref:hypothetical protein n=1 Tax=Lentzea sp. NPDC051838 TaxID=3154849 RepID=UPI00341C8E88
MVRRRTLLVVGDLDEARGTLARYEAEGVRTVVVPPSDDLTALHLAALIERHQPQVVITGYEDLYVLRITKQAIYSTGIPAKLYLTTTGGSTVIDTGDGANASQEHYFRALDTTNAPLPETDLFAGI